MANTEFDAGAPPSLAEQALENLVNQFARPLDFLRELAQNSIDAGSPRIEVAVAFDPPDEGDEEGVLRIHVDDYGEGMDEDIIDNQLTRLFSSTKEDDLTKIGKFGIGFTSIFAIQPEAVLLRTGRHGEYWELLFHADRSFDKIRTELPIQGTKIALFKRMPSDRVAPFVQEVRFVLDYWCEHSDTPLTFEDRTQDTAVVRPSGDDPFQAFADGAHGTAERINRPLAIDAALQHFHEEDGLEVAIGYADPARFGFYNGGLTLLNTQNTDVLGEHAEQLAHLSFRVKHDGLEHTLTRDNVLHDYNWERAMAGV
ncbi:MAG: ATP-binding protein, partial [Myxococcota bacterium]